jgi:hypothetical protein
MNNPNNNAGQEDYVDKAFKGVANKFGGAQGKKIAGNRGMSEKIVRTTRTTHAQYSRPC